MINTTRVFLISLAVLAVCAIKDTEVGVNDWSRENIGELIELGFVAGDATTVYREGHGRVFFLSQLGLFGHLNKKTGEIVDRRALGENERVIESTSEQLVIVTQNAQIVRYSKQTLLKTVDNRLLTRQPHGIHSHATLSNPTTGGRVYAANSSKVVVLEDSVKKIAPLELIDAPEGKEFLRVFVGGAEAAQKVYALARSAQGVTLYELSNGLVAVKTYGHPLVGVTYASVSRDGSTVFHGDESKHYSFNVQTGSLKQLPAKPTHIGSSDYVVQEQLYSLGSHRESGSTFTIETNGNKPLYHELTQSKLVLYSQPQKQGELVSINLPSANAKVLHVWVNILSSTELQIVVQFEDLELVLYRSRHGGVASQAWSRDESLAYVDRVLFMKYEGYEDRLNTPYHVRVDSPAYEALSFADKLAEVPSNVAARVLSQVQSIVATVLGLVGEIERIATDASAMSQVLNIQTYLQSSMSPEKEKELGFRKYLLVITKKNTYFSIDTKTSQTLWKKQFPRGEQLVSLIKLKQQYEKQVAVAVTFKNGQTRLHKISQGGAMTLLESFDTKSAPTVHKISDHALVLRAGHDIFRFDINRNLQGIEKQYNFYSVEEGRIVGYKSQSNKLVPTWSFQIPSEETLISTASVYKGRSEAHLPLVNEKKVVFKNVDFSNLAVLTLEEYLSNSTQGVVKMNRLHLYLLNGLTGIVQFSEYQNDINPKHPTNLVYDQHNAIVSYYNPKNRVYEIWSVEAFQIPNESEIISKKYQPEIQADNIEFRSNVFGTMIPIKKIFISESRHGLLKRNLIILTREDKVYNMPRELISTRRPKTADAEAKANLDVAEFITSRYPPESYKLPINPLFYLDHARTLHALEQVRLSSTDLESTILVAAYGVDLFLCRITPDRSFDLLADGFSYWKLMAVIVAVTAGVLVVHSWMADSKLRKVHID